MKSCFFTGHRTIKDNTGLSNKLIALLTDLINNGVIDFYAGGALGFDMLCEKIVLDLRNSYPQIKLHLVLPCQLNEQTAKWSEAQKQEFNKIFKSADSIEIISKSYYKGCMKKRNFRLAEQGEMCICYYNKNHSRSGTAQTVRMAERLNRKIYNLFS